MYSAFGHVSPLEIVAQPEGPDTTLFLVGELDLCSQRSLMEALSGPVSQGEGRLILDLSRIEFLDASGLRALREAYKLLGKRLLVRAPSDAAWRVLELTGFGHRLPVQVGRGKLEYVRSLWEAFLTGGAPAISDLVPDQVEWMPWGAEGRILHGSREMREFWSGRSDPPPRAVEFTELGNDVLVHVEVPSIVTPGGLSEHWSVYHFESDRLTQAITFADRDQALSFV